MSDRELHQELQKQIDILKSGNIKKETLLDRKEMREKIEKYRKEMTPQEQAQNILQPQREDALMESQIREYETLMNSYEKQKNTIKTNSSRNQKRMLPQKKGNNLALTSSEEVVNIESQENVQSVDTKIRNEVEKKAESVRVFLAEMSLDNLQKAINTIDQYATLEWIQDIPAAKNLDMREIHKYEPLVRGMLGGILLSDLQGLGYQLTFTSQNQIRIDSQKNDRVEVETKINHNLAKSNVLVSALQSGLLYANNPSFANYSKSVSDTAKKNENGELIYSDKVTQEDYTSFLRKKSQGGTLTASEQSFLSSARYLNNIDFPLTVEQYQSIGPVLSAAEKINNSPLIREATQAAINPIENGNNPADNSVAAKTGRGVGAVAGGIGKGVGVAVSGTTDFFGTMIQEAGPLGGVAIIGGILWSMFSSKGLGFWKTLGAMLGVGAISNFDKLGEIFNGIKPINSTTGENGDKFHIFDGITPETSGVSSIPYKEKENTSIHITDTQSLRRVTLGLEEDSNIDVFNNIVTPIGSLSVYQWLHIHDEKGATNEKIKASIGFDTLDPAGKKAIDTILENESIRITILNYFARISQNPIIENLRKTDAARAQNMTLSQMEAYIISHSLPIGEEDIKKNDNLSGKPVITNTTEAKESNIWMPVMAFREGNMYFIGKDGNQKLFEYSTLSPEAKNGFEKFKDQQKILEKYLLLIQALGNKINANKEIENLLSGKLSPEQFFDTIDKILGKWLPDLNEKHLQNLKGLLRSNHPDATIKFYEYIKDGLDGYTIVSDILTEKLVDKTLLTTQLQKLQSGNFTENAIRELGLSPDRTEDMIEKRARYYAMQGERKNRFAKEAKNDSVMLDAMMKIDEENAMMMALQYNLAYDAVKQGTSKGTIGEIELFKDIEGIGLFTIKDTRADWYSLALETLAVQVVAVAAGAFTGSAGYWAVNGARGAALMARLNQLRGLGTLGRIGAGAIGAIGSGTAFHVGYSAVIGGYENGINGAINQTFDTSGWMTSIAFMGAGKLLSQLHGKLNIAPQVGQKFYSIPAMQRLTIDGTMLGIGGGMLNVYLDGGEWSHESIIQGFMMAIAMRGMNRLGNIKLTRGKSGEVHASEQRPDFIVDSAGNARPTKGNTKNTTSSHTESGTNNQNTVKSLAMNSKEWINQSWDKIQGASLSEQLGKGSKILGGKLETITGRKFYGDLLDAMILKNGFKETSKKIMGLGKAAFSKENMRMGIIQTVAFTAADAAGGKEITREELLKNLAVATAFGGWKGKLLAEYITDFDLAYPGSDTVALIQYMIK